MSLPEPTWLSLGKVLELVTARGEPIEPAKERLFRAFRHQEISTRYIDQGKTWETSLYQWEDPNQVNWQESTVTRPGFDYEFSFGSEPDFVVEIWVSRDALIKWLNGTEANDADRNSTKETSNDAARSGRPPKYDWEAFYVEIAVLADLDALPRIQGDLESHMADWCQEKWGKTPGESTIRSKISPIYKHSRKTQGQ